MSDCGELPRRSIEELLARYDLEPTLRDLYVEGIRDKAVYGWYLRGTGHEDVSVYDIGSVDVSSELLSSHGLGSGNRERVIALALELDSDFAATLPYVRCVADSDFDFVLDTRTDARHLLYTDYTSIDLYTYDKELLGKVLLLGFGLPDSELELLLGAMSSMLKELFAVRATNRLLGWEMSLVSFTRCCTIDGPKISFDSNVFLTRCLNNASRLGERDKFESAYRELVSTQLDDDRKGIHSGDFLELLGWYLNRKYNWGGYQRERRSILPMLVATLDVDSLGKERLFSDLNTIYGQMVFPTKSTSSLM